MKTSIGHYPGKLMTVPLIILAFLSITAGFIEWPHNLAHLTFFSDFVQKVLPETVLRDGLPAEIIFQGIAVIATLGGIYFGYLLYYHSGGVKWQQSPTFSALRNFLFSGWRFDDFYEVAFVKPFKFITRINKSDVFDKIYNGIASLNIKLNQLLSISQNGSLRWYAVGVLIGILFILTLQLMS